jgi:hypothetical protein
MELWAVIAIGAAIIATAISGVAKRVSFFIVSSNVVVRLSYCVLLLV